MKRPRVRNHKKRKRPPILWNKPLEVPPPSSEIVRMALGQMFAAVIPLECIQRVMEKAKDREEEEPGTIQ